MATSQNAEINQNQHTSQSNQCGTRDSPPSYRSMENSYHIEIQDQWQPEIPTTQ